MTDRRPWQNPNNPIAVLSTAPARTGSCFAGALAAVLVHGVVLAGIGSRMLRPVDQAEAAAIDVIEVVTVTPARADPGLAATATESLVSEPPVENPVPMDALAEPVQPASLVASETPHMAEQAEVAEAPPQPPAAVEAVPSIPPVAMGPPARKAALTKLFRPAPVPRAAFAGVPGALAAAGPEVNAAGRAAPSGDGAMDHSTLTGRIRNAVQAAVQCPVAARMMGQSGKAAVAFEYRDGALVGGLELSQSSGTPLLDTAAVAAVRNAHLPKAPPADSNQVLHLLVWVDEACSG